ncbi:MAG: SDR family NAD(P)-dependent oxidoreductase [Pseudomonadota bacterium]
MIEFAGKTAVITGGADGIGLDLARALGQRGMNIVITDIEAPQLAKAASALNDLGIQHHAVEMDVAVRSDWERTARETVDTFGDVHMLINNAGVSGGVGSIENLDEEGWRWCIDVNLMGTVYGANTMVPLMKGHGEPSWLINVASMAGMGGVPLAGGYTATKAAVVAMTEAWSEELAASNIKVSVLAPAYVKTRIYLSHRNRQARYPMSIAPTPEMMMIAKSSATAVTGGIEPSMLSDRLIEGLESGQLYIFTHPNYKSATDDRSAAIASAFEDACASPIVGALKNDPINTGFSEDLPG